MPIYASKQSGLELPSLMLQLCNLINISREFHRRPIYKKKIRKSQKLDDSPYNTNQYLVNKFHDPLNEGAQAEKYTPGSMLDQLLSSEESSATDCPDSPQTVEQLRWTISEQDRRIAELTQILNAHNIIY